MSRRALLLAASGLAGLAAAACVVWPEGTGPAAGPVPLAQALELQGRGEAVLIDVRPEDSWTAGHIPGALSIPADAIDRRAADIRRMGKLPILYCG